MLTRSWLIAYFLLGVGSCGSVGGGIKVDGGGGTGGAAILDGSVDASSGAGGSDAGTSGTGGQGTRDAAAGTGGHTTDAGLDAPGEDGGALPVSCQQIKQLSPTVASGTFTIAPLGTPQNTFCEMTVDGGGWTAFYVSDNGSAPGGAHFETAADTCADPPNSCLRRLPPTIDVSRDFAVKCGAAVVKFKVSALALDYFKNGLQHGWQPLTGAVTIDLVNVGKSNLVASVWTGDSGDGNSGWIVAGDANTPTTTFGNGYTTNASWNFCNGAADNTSRVMLLYR